MAGTVSFDGIRLDTAETLTDWTTWGASPTIEVDYKYQGLYCISAQVKKDDVGFYYLSPTTYNFTTNDYVFISKIIQTNKDDIDEEGLRLFVGNDVTNYYQFDIYPLSTDYPIPGGFQVVPVNPNIAAYRDVTVGTPDMTTVDFYGIRSNASQQSKAPNLGMDAVDIIPSGSGYTLTGTDATFQDFIDFDEGNINNRYGIVSTRDGILYVTGVLTLGTSVTSISMDDTDVTIVYPGGRFGDGFCGVDLNFENVGTTITLNNITFIGRGLSGTTDTRPDYEVIGNNSSLLMNSCVLTNFNLITLQSNTTIVDNTFNTGEVVYQNSADITGAVFNQFTSGSTILVDTVDNITDCTFISDGSNHGIEFLTGGTYNFFGNEFIDYAAVSGDTGNEAIYNNSGSHLTLNIKDGGSNPSYRNSLGSTTTIYYGLVSLTLTGLVVGTEVRIYTVSGMTELAGVESGITDTFVYPYLWTEDIPVYIQIFNIYYIPITLYVTLGDTDNSIPIQQQYDRNYNNPP